MRVNTKKEVFVSPSTQEMSPWFRSKTLNAACSSALEAALKQERELKFALETARQQWGLPAGIIGFGWCSPWGRLSMDQVGTPFLVVSKGNHKDTIAPFYFGGPLTKDEPPICFSVVSDVGQRFCLFVFGTGLQGWLLAWDVAPKDRAAQNGWGEVLFLRVEVHTLFIPLGFPFQATV